MRGVHSRRPLKIELVFEVEEVHRRRQGRVGTREYASVLDLQVQEYVGTYCRLL